MKVTVKDLGAAADASSAKGTAFRELLDVAPVLEVELTRQLAWACSPESKLQLH